MITITMITISPMIPTPVPSASAGIDNILSAIPRTTGSETQCRGLRATPDTPSLRSSVSPHFDIGGKWLEASPERSSAGSVHFRTAATHASRACVRSYEDRGARGGLLYVSSLSAEIATLAGSTHHSFRRFRRVLRGRRAQDTALAADDANGRRRVETRRFDGVGSRCAALLPGVWQGCYMGCESEVGQAESGFECAQEGVGGGGAVEAVVGLAVAGDDEEGDASGPFQCPSGRFRLRGADQLLAYMDASANSFPSRAAPTSCPRRTSRGRPVGGTARQVGRRRSRTGRGRRSGRPTRGLGASRLGLGGPAPEQRSRRSRVAQRSEHPLLA
jgi:hypothetical protein